jgi:hypothetical protein
MENAMKLIEYSQKDYRRLLSILQDIKSNFGDNPNTIANGGAIVMTNGDIDEYCRLSKRKDIDVDIYKATSNMILKYQNIDECLRLYEGKCIYKFHPTGKNIFKLANDISKSIATGDLIENYIYSDQNWDMQEVHGFLTCVNPSYKLSKENFKTRISEENLCYELNFPIDLNRTSIKRINKRNVVNSNMCLKNLEIKDFIYANRLIRKLLDDNKLEECAELFRGYNAKVENIESILKIDKINETKTIIPTQIKKKLSTLLSKHYI